LLRSPKKGSSSSGGEDDDLFIYYADLSGFIDPEHGSCTMQMLRAGGDQNTTGPKMTSVVELRSGCGRHKVALQSPVGEVRAWDPREKESQAPAGGQGIVSSMLDALWEDASLGGNTKKLRVSVTLTPQEPQNAPTPHNAIETLQALESQAPDFSSPGLDERAS